MSILSVANVHFETTGANRIEYLEANGFLNLVTSGNIAISSRNFTLSDDPGASGNVFTSNGTTWISQALPPFEIDVFNETTSGNTFYVTLTSTSGGKISYANVSNTKLYYTPNTGTLSATNFNTLSDKNFKKDIEPITDALEKVDALVGVTFSWVDSNQKSMGVLAQNVETIAPELVTDNNGRKSVNYDGLIGLLVEAVKELKTRVEILENSK